MKKVTHQMMLLTLIAVADRNINYCTCFKSMIKFTHQLMLLTSINKLMLPFWRKSPIATTTFSVDREKLMLRSVTSINVNNICYHLMLMKKP